MGEAIALVVAYLLGSLPIGLVVGKVFRGVDIRDYGSGNIGTTNVLRTLGPKLATLVFIGDTLKGLLAVLLAAALVTGAHQQYIVVAAGMLSIVGHMASPFLRFKGGKGVATSLGVIIGMSPIIAAIAFGLWVLIVIITRYVSLASIISCSSVWVMMFFSEQLFGRATPHSYTGFALLAAGLILLKHRSNLSRLLNGTERKFGQKVQLEGE